MTLCSLYLLSVQAVLLLATGRWANGQCSPGKQMEVIYEFKLIEFLWPSEEAKEEAIKSGEYDPKNCTSYDIDFYEGRYFVTTPRFFNGCPATLSTISEKKQDGQHLFKPFPDWKHNKLGNCNGLTNVFAIQIDQFGRLWAVDAGIVDTIGKLTRVCQPKLVVYDLTDGDKVVGTYLVPDNVLDCNSALFTFQVDIRDNDPNDVYVYIADVYGYHIVVFDLRRLKFYRVTHNTFLPNPYYADFYVAGVRLQRSDGIYSLALGPICNKDRRVYYHALPSLEECYVMASTLRDKAFMTNERAFPDSFYCYSHLRASQAGPEVITDDGVMFFDQLTLNSINCWNTEIDYNMDNTAVVARNDTTMQATEGIKVVGTDLIAMSSRLQLFVYGLLPEDQINFRVLRASIEDLLCGTPCTKPCPQNGTNCKT